MTMTDPGTKTNARLEAIFTDVLDSLLGVIRKHQVTWEEYRVATVWLTEAGAQGFEIPLMLDVFLSQTVDDVNFAAQGGTESNVEGPFYVPDSQPPPHPAGPHPLQGEASLVPVAHHPDLLRGRPLHRLRRRRCGEGLPRHRPRAQRGGRDPLLVRLRPRPHAGRRLNTTVDRLAWILQAA
jgi:hypothetical protein